MKRSALTGIAFLSGMSVVLGYFWSHPVVTEIAGRMVAWRTVVSAFALGIGVVNLLGAQVKAVSDRQKDWDGAVLLILSVVVFSGAGMFGGTAHSTYTWGFNYIYQPIYSGISSLLAFTITSASYRAFRVRNWQSALLMVSAVVVMLGQMGLSSMPSLSAWIMEIPNTAGVRGITIGGALGAIAMSLRILFGLERGYAGGGGA